jgi:flagellar basal body rod protein FlgC
MSVNSIALSGLDAAQKRLEKAAGNIANATTPGFKAKDVAQTTQADGSVKTDIVDRNPATITVADGQGGTQELPNSSPEEELLDAKLATYTFKANLRLLKTEDDLQDSAVDIIS